MATYRYRFQPGEGLSRGLLRHCENRYTALENTLVPGCLVPGVSSKQSRMLPDKDTGECTGRVQVVTMSGGWRGCTHLTPVLALPHRRLAPS